MNLSPSIKRSVLIALALVLEAVDKRITEEQNRLEEATQKPLDKPINSCQCITTCVCIKPLRTDPKLAYANDRYKLTIDDNGMVTSISNRPSKYKLTDKDIAEGYRTNPYRNYNI